ncbi:MAG: hypothetical protein Q7U15_06150 [Methylotenera sp.]|jgi:hypothetical protein|nr:hypothetical protein [Methylotenera sp.]
MTPQQLVGIAIRMFSITMVLFSIPYLSGMPHVLRSNGMDDKALVSLMIGVTYLAVALVSWFFPMVISHKLVPKTTFENRFNTRPDEVATVGIAMLGLWKVIDAAPDLVSYLFQTSLRAGSGSIFEALSAEGKADVFFILIELIIALAFLFKAHLIAKFITRPFENHAT